jgi:hypothetical protein
MCFKSLAMAERAKSQADIEDCTAVSTRYYRRFEPFRGPRTKTAGIHSERRTSLLSMPSLKGVEGKC